MQHTVYEALLSRVANAPTIAALRAIALEVRTANPGDPDAERIADRCQERAMEMLARLRSRGGVRARGPLPLDYSERAYR